MGSKDRFILSGWNFKCLALDTYYNIVLFNRMCSEVLFCMDMCNWDELHVWIF